MPPSGDATIYVFGDRHTDSREDVKERLHSVIPDTADVLVIEHAEEGDDQPQPSQWVALKNPSLVVLELLTVAVRFWRRNTADRVSTPNQTTVAEEVAEERGLPMEYTDISHLRRVQEQPWYLTLTSWAAILIGVVGLLVHVGYLLLSALAVTTVALLSLKVHNRMREEEMARNLLDAGTDYTEIVYFAGDSHIDPIRERLHEELDVIEEPNARP